MSSDYLAVQRYGGTAQMSYLKLIPKGVKIVVQILKLVQAESTNLVLKD